MLEVLIKRDGRQEALSPVKLNGWGQWASEQLNGRVEWSSAALAAVAKLGKVATTRELMDSLISELLDLRTYPAYMMAGRLYAVQYRKDIFKSLTPPTVWEQHARLQAIGFIREMPYTREQYAQIEGIIDHERDYHYPEYAIKFIREKYAIRNHVTGEVFETPQFLYIRMAMAAAETKPEHERVHWVKRFYDAFSLKKLSAPTPNYLYLGTHHYGWASCCIYAATDDEESLAIGNYIAWKMTVNSAGLGSFMSTRTVGDPIAGGRVMHGGKYKYYDAMAKNTIANKQAARGGAGTASFSCFDPENIDIVQYRNPLMPADKQNRDLHFCMLANAWFASKVAKNEEIFTFTEYSAPDLFDAFFSPDLKKFVELYKKYEADESFPKKYVSARTLVLYSFGEAFDTGTAYLSFIDEMNKHTPFKITADHRIHSSNLCVSYGTKILTDRGYAMIGKLWGEKARVYNGKEWSTVEIVKTGENVMLTRVKASNGMSGNFTAEHKWYIKDTLKGGIKEVRTSKLVVGDELIEFDYPIIEGHGGISIAYSMGSSKALTEAVHTSNVPTRLRWIAGLIDNHGVKATMPEGKMIVVKSGDEAFLQDVQLLITTVGIRTSIVEVKSDKDDSSAYYLQIGARALAGLIAEGMHLNNTDLEEAEYSIEYNKITIAEVTPNALLDDTYCFTEPKRHMGVFAGLLTGQCNEIMEVQAPYMDMQDLFRAEDHGRGEIAMCNLAAIAVENIESEEEYAETAYLALSMIDYTILNSKYPFKHLEYTAKQRMNAGVGIMGLATHMARKGLKWDTTEGKQEIHKVFERHMYHLIKASIRISKERGLAPWIHKTKWPEGWTPLATYNKSVDTIAPFTYEYDWNALSEEIKANGGIAHSVVCAMMPGESSSKALGSTNAVYPVRSTVIVKTDGDNNLIRWAATDGDLLGDAYQSAWDISPIEMVKCYAVMQKWCDQGISADMYRKFEPGETKVSEKEVVETFLAMTKYGMKGRYYTNTLRPKVRSMGEAVKLDLTVNNTTAEKSQEPVQQSLVHIQGQDLGVVPKASVEPLMAGANGVSSEDLDSSTYSENAKELCDGFCSL